MTLDMFFQHLLNALQWGSFYALIALGYNMVYGVLSLFNFAHGDIFMAGAYLGYFVSIFLVGASAVGFPIALPTWLILILTLALSMIGTALLGMTIERVAYRPLREAPKVSAAVTGLMVGLLMETSNLFVLGASRRNFPPLIQKTVYNIGGVSFTNIKVMIIVLSILVMLGLEFVVRRTKVGMAMRAISFDTFIVPLMGVPRDRIISITFAIGSGLAALAGILFGIAYPVLEPYMGALIGWKAFTAAVVGGIGSITGAAVGGFLLGFIEIFVAAVFPSTLRDLIAYSIMLIILTVRPRGLFGVARRQKV